MFLNNDIIDSLRLNSELFPDKVAYRFLFGPSGRKDITFRQFWNNILATAQALETSVFKEELVILCFEDVEQFIIPFFSMLCLGKTSIPVAMPKSSRRTDNIIHVLKDSGAKAIICSEESLSKVNLLLKDKLPSDVCLLGTGTKNVDEGSFSRKHSINDIAYIQYTSGSTYRPKGVGVSYKQIYTSAVSISSAFGTDENSIIASWLPFYHDMGLVGTILQSPFVRAETIFFAPAAFIQNPRRWLDVISEFRVSHSGGPNFSYDLCTRVNIDNSERQLDLASWRVAYSGSEPVRATTIRQFTDRFRKYGFEPSAVVPCYGMAEATLLVSGNQNKTSQAARVHHIDQNLNFPVVSCGTPASGIRILIRPVNNVKLQSMHQETGEILISGESVCQSYWNKPFHLELIDGGLWFHTGDIGFILDNELFVIGRRSDIVIIRGQNIHLADIEYSVVNNFTDRQLLFACAFTASDDLIEGSDLNLSIAVQLGSYEKDDSNTLESIARAITLIVNQSFSINLSTVIFIKRDFQLTTSSGKVRRDTCRLKYLQGQLPVVSIVPVVPTKLFHTRKAKASHVLLNPNRQAIQDYCLDLLYTRVSADLLGDLNHGSSLYAMGVDSIGLVEIFNIVNEELGLAVRPSFIDDSLERIINMIYVGLWRQRVCGFTKE